jgi:hypothetical protein
MNRFDLGLLPPSIPFLSSVKQEKTFFPNNSPPPPSNQKKNF